jgi:hypothetical protein
VQIGLRLIAGLALLVASAAGTIAASPLATHAQAGMDWQTSAPRDPVSAFSAVTLGLRNKFGADGECYAFSAEVDHPFGDVAATGTFNVCGSDWTYLQFANTTYEGTYTVFFAIGDTLVAQDRFDVVD